MKLFSTKNRNEAHQYLEAVIWDGSFPHAHCQEDINKSEPYEVHSGTEVAEGINVKDEFTADQVTAIVALKVLLTR